MNETLKVSVLRSGFIEGQLKRHSLEAAGHDLVASEDCELAYNELKIVKTGLKMAIPRGWVGIIKERSGLAVRGIVVHGGVIDSDYRGEVGVILRNSLISGGNLNVTAGMRIAQMIFVRCGFLEQIELVDSFEDSSARGSAGFGSTGTGGTNETR